jgi:hypothetical protein
MSCPLGPTPTASRSAWLRLLLTFGVRVQAKDLLNATPDPGWGTLVQLGDSQIPI